MRTVILLVGLLGMAGAARPAENPYAPLTLYNGTWHVTRKDSPKPNIQVNQCAKVGHYYTCDQSVDGSPGALLVFIPRPDKPGRYYTQNIRPEGRATSRGDLEISGNVWTFYINWDAGGRTIFYRTVQTFVSRNRITYEQAESSNNKDWKVTNSGEQTRVPATRR